MAGNGGQVKSSGGGLTRLAAIAEIVAAIAVVMSLIFVGREVRQNTAATQAATYQEMIRASNEYLLALASDSALTAIVRGAETDPTSLSDTEMRRYFSYSRVFWRNMDNAFVQHERGVLAEADWEVYRGIACARSRVNDQSWVWDMHADALSPEFVAVMNDC
jgi:hypothetical protein